LKSAIAFVLVEPVANDELRIDRKGIRWRAVSKVSLMLLS
jgi:hypothetical protein